MSAVSGLALALGLSVLSTGAAWAQQGAPAGGGACAPVPDMTPEKASSFMQNPAGLLEQNGNVVGGVAMAVRDLVVSQPQTIPAMVTLANQATPDQLRAVGAGLGTAAAMCVLSQPATAQRIQEAVLATNKPEIVMAYTSIVGDVATEAIPDLPATGETTAGGARNPASTQSGGGATGSSAVQPGSLFTTLSAANRQSNAALFAISPSN